jgi:signal transduction histidine kinase
MKGYRDLRDADAEGRLADTASPVTLGLLVFLAFLATASVMFIAGASGTTALPLLLGAIAAMGVGTSAGVALATSRYFAQRQADEAQQELLSLHGELELERTERRALVHDARAAAGAMGAALHALERSEAAPEVARALGAQVDHLRELLEAPSTQLRATPVRRFHEPLTSFANLHQLSVEVDLPTDQYVMCEPTSVTTILQNLADNARKHAPGSPIRVGWRPAGAHLELVVEDRGPGMRGDVETHFRAGTRGWDSATEGSGLGLATARRLAEKNQGNLWYEHREGTGARFVLRLHRALPDHGGAP